MLSLTRFYFVMHARAGQFRAQDESGWLLASSQPDSTICYRSDRRTSDALVNSARFTLNQSGFDPPSNRRKQFRGPLALDQIDASNICSFELPGHLLQDATPVDAAAAARWDVRSRTRDAARGHSTCSDLRPAA